MNQGKLDVVKQEMARVNINILGICELKWMGMENLIQMTIIPTIILEKKGGSPHNQQESPKYSTWVQRQK